MTTTRFLLRTAGMLLLFTTVLPTFRVGDLSAGETPVPKTDATARPSGFVLPDDKLDLLTETQQTITWSVSRCQIDMKGLTTGWCLEISPKCQRHYAGYGCAGGNVARQPRRSSCGLYDAGRGC